MQDAFTMPPKARTTRAYKRHQIDKACRLRYRAISRSKEKNVLVAHFVSAKPSY